MTYCVQCGTKVKEMNRHCNTCGVSMALQNQHFNHLFTANHLASQTPSYPDTGSTLSSETERPYLFIYIVIIVIYFLLTLGLWIHKNHQARISSKHTAVHQQYQSPEQILSKTATAESAEKKSALPKQQVTLTHPKKSAEPRKKSTLSTPAYPPANNEYFQPPFMLGILKKNSASHELAAPATTAVNNAANDVSIADEPSDHLLKKLLTGITSNGGQLPCSDVEKLLRQCD